MGASLCRRIFPVGPPIAVGGDCGGGEGGNPPPLPPLLPLPAPHVALLPPAGYPPADPRLVTAALATLRAIAVLDAACSNDDFFKILHP